MYYAKWVSTYVYKLYTDQALVNQVKFTNQGSGVHIATIGPVWAGTGGIQSGDTLHICDEHGDVGSGSIFYFTGLKAYLGDDENSRITITGECPGHIGKIWRTSRRYPSGTFPNHHYPKKRQNKF